MQDPRSRVRRSHRSLSVVRIQRDQAPLDRCDKYTVVARARSISLGRMPESHSAGCDDAIVALRLILGSKDQTSLPLAASSAITLSNGVLRYRVLRQMTGLASKLARELHPPLWKSPVSNVQARVKDFNV